MVKGAPRNAPQLLSKAALVLDYLAEKGELAVSELSELMDEPRSSVYRLIASLETINLIERGSRRGTYCLGLKLFRLGSTVVLRFDVRQAAFPVMEQLHAETGQTVFLSIRQGYEAVCIERIDGRWVQAMALRLGGSLPLHIGAGPRVLLAYQPEEFWSEYLGRGGLDSFTPGSPTTPTQLLTLLREIQSVGVSISDQDVVLGMGAVGAPIFNHHGDVCAALSMSGPLPTILGKNAEQSRRLIANGATEVSRALGYLDEQADPSDTEVG